MEEANAECYIYTDSPHECLNTGHCGWCNDNNKCVKGNRIGPYNNLCSKGNYIYFAPSLDWNPFNKSEMKRVIMDIDTNITFTR